MTYRASTKPVQIGSRVIGGGNPVLIQSMCNTKTEDSASTIAQILELERAGCDIIRVAVPTMEAAESLKTIKKAIHIPLVADIHFDYRLALTALEAGLEGLRINPGNIGPREHVDRVVDAAKANGAVIRVGVNSGSVEREILAKYGAPTPEALVESALYHASLLERFDFGDIVLSLKSSTVDSTIRAYELCASRCDYPLHLGVTEAGTERMGLIKSSIGIGSLLQRGIGDTLRVSLTADPVREVAAGLDILHALGLRPGPQLVSCPTCGRTRIDLIAIANEVEARLASCTKNIKVAVMGCVVNGPGEAREADVGIAGGKGEGLVFRKGEIVRKVPEEHLVDELMKEIELL